MKGVFILSVYNPFNKYFKLFIVDFDLNIEVSNKTYYKYLLEAAELCSPQIQSQIDRDTNYFLSDQDQKPTLRLRLSNNSNKNSIKTK